MIGRSIQIPSPTLDLVSSYVKKFDETQAIVESALAKLVAQFPENRNLEEVLLKVVTLNDLYRTGILATSQVADHIFRLNIDPALRDGREDAVGMIARVRLGKKERNNYSFATKYCAWHNPCHYPIYDSFVDRMIWEYKKQYSYDAFHRSDLLDYKRFKEIVFRFQESYGLLSFSIRDIDKFLWLAGKEYYPATWATV